MAIYVNNVFLPETSFFHCFPLTYDLNYFKPTTVFPNTLKFHLTAPSHPTPSQKKPNAVAHGHWIVVYLFRKTFEGHKSQHFKDTHGEKALSNKTAALRKSTNMGAWAVGTLSQLLIRGS